MTVESPKTEQTSVLDKIRKMSWVHWLGVILSISMWNITIFYSNTDFAQWGIFDGLFFTYYIGLFLSLLNLALSLFVFDKKFYVYITTFIIFFYLFAIGVFISRLPNFYALKFIGHWEYIDRNQEFGLWYHSWPGMFLLTGLLASPITNPIKYKFTIVFFPIIYIIIFSGLLFLTIKSVQNLISDPERKNSKFVFLLILIIMSLYNWIGQDFYNAQGIALILFLLGFCILCNFNKKIQQENLTSREVVFISLKELLLYGLVQVALTVTHLLTSIALLSTVLVYILFYMIKIVRSENVRRRSKVIIISGISTLFLAFLGIMLSSKWVRLRIADIFRGNISFKPSVLLITFENLASASPIRLFIIIIRLVLSSFFIVVVLIVLFKKLRKRQHISLPILSLIISLIVVFFVFTFLYVSDELTQRLYLYSIPLVIYSIYKLKKLRNKKTLFLISIIICPMFFISRYGNLEVELVSEGELRLTEYLEENYENRTLIMSNHEILRGRNYELFSTTKLSDVEFNGTIFVYTNDSITPFTNYHLVVFSKEYYFRSVVFNNNNEPYLLLDILLNSGNYLLVYSEDLNFVLQRLI